MATNKEALSTSRAAKTVTVYCKHPNGVVLQLYQMVEQQQAKPGGYETVKVAQKLGEPVRVNGNRVPLDEKGQPREIDYLIIGGYALTAGVDAEFFQRWLEQNKHHPMVKNGLIGAHFTEEGARKEAKERQKTLSGLEPLVPDKDPRIPRRVDGKSAIQSFDGKAEAA